MYNFVCPCVCVFNDTIEGPSAPAIKPGRVTLRPAQGGGGFIRIQGYCKGTQGACG